MRNVSTPQDRPDNSPNGYKPESIANMSEIQADLPERKPRKSVAFSEGATIVDSDGQVTESKEVNGGKSTAESHSGEPSPPTGQDAFTHDEQHGLTSGVIGDADKEVDEVTDMFADLAKKVRIKA
jgi:translation initiation factor 2 subunit 2